MLLYFIPECVCIGELNGDGGKRIHTKVTFQRKRQKFQN